MFKLQKREKIALMTATGVIAVILVTSIIYKEKNKKSR